MFTEWSTWTTMSALSLDFMLKSPFFFVPTAFKQNKPGKELPEFEGFPDDD